MTETPQTPETAQEAPARQGGFHATAPVDPGPPGPSVVHRTRKALGQLIWIAFSLAALLLALGALFIAFEANDDNALVKWVLDAAEWLDLGVFDKDEGIKRWTSENAETKNALFGWGLGVLVWLVAGRILDQVVRPKEK